MRVSALAALPPPSPAADLVRAGIVVRAAGRLRLCGRALAHAEAAAAAHGLPPAAAIEHGLRACGYRGDLAAAAAYLHDLLAGRGQLGLLQPAFAVPCARARG